MTVTLSGIGKIRIYKPQDLFKSSLKLCLHVIGIQINKQMEEEQEAFEAEGYPPFGKQVGKQPKGMSDKNAEGKALNS